MLAFIQKFFLSSTANENNSIFFPCHIYQDKIHFFAFFNFKILKVFQLGFERYTFGIWYNDDTENLCEPLTDIIIPKDTYDDGMKMVESIL